VAILRVVLYHMFTAAWFSFAFPAMGIMFALGGSLMAQSASRDLGRAIRSRIRRLLPALWVVGVVTVPLMFWHGWSADDQTPPQLDSLLMWIFPLLTPPGSDWAEPITEVLWYLVTYLWLVLLSPLMLWAYRRFPVPAILFPLVLLAGLEFGPALLPGSVQDALVDAATFAPCWMLGFAHREGSLRKVPAVLLLAVAGAAIAVGVWWAAGHPDAEDGYDLNAIPMAQACYSIGVVLLLMRVSPTMKWLARVHPLDRLVSLLNSRAVTIYLWHNVAIALCFAVGDQLDLWWLGASYENYAYLAVALLLLQVPLLLFGWVEDVAARRRPRLFPWRPTPRAATAPPAPALANAPQ
jgi:hypothetical protein